jgi:hypothetical protein
VTAILHARKSVRYTQLPCGFLDKRPCASGTGALHEYLLVPGSAVSLKEDCLHIFPADLADEANSRVELFNSSRHRNDFLDYFSTGESGDDSGSGSGEENIISVRGQSVSFFQPAQKIADFFGLFGPVPLVFLREDLASVGTQNILAGRAAYIQAAVHEKTSYILFARSRK